MMWMTLIILGLITALWVTGPLVRAGVHKLVDSEIEDYQAQITQLNDLALQEGAESSALESQKRILQRRLIQSQKSAHMGGPMQRTAIAIFAALLLGSGLIYGSIGSPKPKSVATKSAINAEPQMTPEAQMEMIQGMVDSLSAKLDENPNDVAGWTRLMRSRLVLGQVEQAKGDIDRMRAAFPDAPETIDQILIDSGWLDAPE